MLNRRSALLLSFVMLSAIQGRALAGAAPPALRSAVSSMTQGGRVYDVALPVSGPSGIESRVSPAGLTIVIRFNQTVSSGTIAVASGKATIKGKPKFAGNSVTLNLTNVADAQEITLGLANISSGGAGLSASLKVRVLAGDVNGDGTVNDADLKLAEKALGTTNGANYRADINASGAVRASDVNQIKANLGKSVAGGANNNTPPVINPIADQKLTSGQVPPGIAVAIKDADSPASAVNVVATSDNAALVPAENVLVTGDGDTRVLTVNPVAGKGGTAHVTVTASDGIASSSRTFTVNVATPPTCYIANLRPESGATNSLGSAQATVLLSSDETQATVRLDYTNLTGTPTLLQIHGAADPEQSAGALFDLGTATANQDGSYTWVFVPTGGLAVADIVTAIKTNRTYMEIATPLYPSGEIRGQLSISQAFVPPIAPPAIASGPPTQNDAARFLTQATFGATAQDISLVQATGFDAWLQQQFDMPPTYSSTSLKTRQGLGEILDDDQFVEAWWGLAVAAPDQLRQRVAFALSEIMVISQNDGDLAGRPLAVADYYDMLVADAFSNYRQLIEDVTLHPAMGNYLDMRGNRAQYLNSSGQIIIPNENYAREVLQLFSIGLYEMQPDGSLILDDQGEPIPTYDQTVIQGFARAFSGWNYHQSGTSTSPGRDDYLPMTPVGGTPPWHEPGTKQLLDGVVLPAGQSAQKDMADTLNLIFKHPNTGPFVCRQLIQRLVSDNPSPGYLYRVSQVFADNGKGVRGDLKAVVRAILLDPEARSTIAAAQPGFGKLKEPLLRATETIRALHPVSATGYFKIPNTETELTQTPMRSPTVFNFFLPNYASPGALTQAGLDAPEMMITYETSAINFSNFMESGTRTSFKGADIKVDLATEQALVNATNGDCTALVDKLNTTLMSGNMSSSMRSTLLTYLNGLSPVTDTLTRARAAVHLISTSPEFCTQK